MTCITISHFKILCQLLVPSLCHKCPLILAHFGTYFFCMVCVEVGPNASGFLPFANFMVKSELIHLCKSSSYLL